ncbi:MAG: hypothetical protein ABI565_13875 [Vicinamibacteria bacterium]
MNLHNTTSWLSAASLGALLTIGSTVPAHSQGVSIQFGRGDRRIEGQRYTTMRGLAHRLDEAAQTAARVAGDTPQERLQRRFLWMINDFARQAQSFHQRMEQYGNEPWDVADEVADLNQRAHRVSSQLRTANAYRDTYRDWADVTSTLNLMNRSLRGQNVSLPPNGNRGYQPFDENSRYRDGRHYEGYGTTNDPYASGVREGYVMGNPLRDFRRLASSLNVETNRLVNVAERDSDPRDRGSRSMMDLRRFAQRASDLSRNSGGDAINSRDTGVVVGQMMDDARQNERVMREGNTFPKVEWNPSIRILEQMTTAVPRP